MSSLLCEHEVKYLDAIVGHHQEFMDGTRIAFSRHQFDKACLTCDVKSLNNVNYLCEPYTKNKNFNSPPIDVWVLK